jgi:dUTP pyrophosphatase
MTLRGLLSMCNFFQTLLKGLRSIDRIVVPPHSVAVVATGLSISVPAGTYGRIGNRSSCASADPHIRYGTAPRSGLAVKHFIDVGAGVIDSDYRGAVGVVLFNHGDKEFAIAPGDRVAQLILENITVAGVVETDALDDTLRGGSGFGSTGMEQAPTVRAK